MTKIAEIVTFRLMPDINQQDFAKAAADMAPFLDRSGGLISRVLSCDETGQWTDHLTWVDMDAAQRAAASLQSAPEAAEFLPMIDPSTAHMRHARIHL